MSQPPHIDTQTDRHTDTHTHIGVSFPDPILSPVHDKIAVLRQNTSGSNGEKGWGTFFFEARQSTYLPLADFIMLSKTALFKDS